MWPILELCKSRVLRNFAAQIRIVFAKLTVHYKEKDSSWFRCDILLSEFEFVKFLI